MKRNISLFAAAALGLAAQDAAKTISATVTFPFEVNGRELPAGKYEAVRQAHRPYIAIRNAASGKSFFVITPGARPNGSGKASLTFDRYGDRHVLTSIADSGAILTVPRSRRARELAKTNNPVTVVASAE